MTTFQVEGETRIPTGELVLTGIVSSYSISKGATCQITVGDTTAEIVVTNIGMLDMDMVEHHLLGMLVRIKAAKSFPLVGCTLNFE